MNSGRRCLWAFLGVFVSLQAMAITPAGTLIKNRAVAWFLDGNDMRQQVSSNEVQTRVQEVTGVRLDSSQTRRGVAGQRVIFPHQLTNTGNVGTKYRLSLSGADALSARLLIDQNNTGQAQGAFPVSAPVYLAPGQSINLLVEALAPAVTPPAMVLGAQVDGVACPPNSTQASQGRCQAVNTDQLELSSGVVYQVSSRMDKAFVATGGSVQIQVDFKRLDSSPGQGVLKLIDSLPQGLTYQSGTALICDASGQCRPVQPDNGGGEPLTFSFQSSPTHQGTLRFQARVSGRPGQTLVNRVGYGVLSAGEPYVSQDSNAVPLKITGTAVVLNGSSAMASPGQGEPLVLGSAPVGGHIEFAAYLWNTGTDPDRFQVAPVLDTNTFPQGTLFCLSLDSQCRQFGRYPTLDTPNIQPGQSLAVYLHIRLPALFDASAVNPQGYAIELEARDSRSQKIWDRLKSWLLAIVDQTPGVDVTLSQSLADNPSAPGQGLGPEPGPLVTRTAAPGATLVIDDLYVNNSGRRSDLYALTLEPAPGSTLPEGLDWRFSLGTSPVVNTGIIKSGQSRRLQLSLTLAKSIKPGRWSLVVRAASPMSSVQDLLHLALTVTAPESMVQLTADSQSQVAPGGSVIFSHRLSNPGSSPVQGIRLQLSDTEAALGWRSLVYLDGDNDGQLSSSDRPVSEPLSLEAGQSLTLFVKVFAPASAASGDENQTRLQVLWGGSQSSRVLDTAMVNSSQVRITKAQAPWSCTGALPGPDRFSAALFPALPGTCVVYRLTASNQGAEAVQNVAIHDIAPGFTQLYSAMGLPRTEGRTPARITTSGQSIQAHWPKGLASGDKAALIYAIKIQ